MTAGGTEAWAKDDGSQLTISIGMNGLHKEGIPRVQALLRAGSGEFRACGIQACNKSKCHNNKCCSAPLFLVSGPVILSKTLKMLLGRSGKLFPGHTDDAPEWFLSLLTSTTATLPCPPLFHSPSAVLYLRFLGCKAMIDLPISSDRVGAECLLDFQWKTIKLVTPFLIVLSSVLMLQSEKCHWRPSVRWWIHNPRH